MYSQTPLISDWKTTRLSTQPSLSSENDYYYREEAPKAANLSTKALLSYYYVHSLAYVGKFQNNVNKVHYII